MQRARLLSVYMQPKERDCKKYRHRDQYQHYRHRHAVSLGAGRWQHEDVIVRYLAQIALGGNSVSRSETMPRGLHRRRNLRFQLRNIWRLGAFHFQHRSRVHDSAVRNRHAVVTQLNPGAFLPAKEKNIHHLGEWHAFVSRQAKLQATFRPSVIHHQKAPTQKTGKRQQIVPAQRQGYRSHMLIFRWTFQQALGCA